MVKEATTTTRALGDWLSTHRWHMALPGLPSSKDATRLGGRNPVGGGIARVRETRAASDSGDRPAMRSRLASALKRLQPAAILRDGVALGSGAGMSDC